MMRFNQKQMDLIVKGFVQQLEDDEQVIKDFEGGINGEAQMDYSMERGIEILEDCEFFESLGD